MEKVLSIIGCLCLVLLVSTGDAIETFARCKLRFNKNTTPDVMTLVSNQKLEGTIWFKEKDGATTISGEITGFTGNDSMKHGFHIHSEGNTTNDCNTNGGHFNPKGVNHGAPNADTRHYGDLGNVVVQGGKATVGNANQNAFVRLTGENNVIGKSIVVHADEDDLGLVDSDDSRSTGNAGGRLACCVIEEYKLVKYEASCELEDNTNANAPGSGGFSGTIRLVQDLNETNPADRRTKIQAVVKGFNSSAPVKMHGFHIHQEGMENNDCNANGGHYNPERQENFHGGPSDDKRHYGDLGNIEAGNGSATVNITDDYVELFGEYDVDGRSFVLHEGTDDFGTGGKSDSRTTGAAGGRLACCKIRKDTSSANQKDTSSANQKASSLTLMTALLFVVAL